MSTPGKLQFGLSPRLPVILQSQVTECGLACLAMVASYHGHQIDLGTLRRRYSVSLAGTSLIDLSRIASTVAMASRALRVELDELSLLKLPTILHWKMQHYVVLKRVTKRGAVIHDPARGSVHVSQKELSDSFSGVVLELWPTAGFSQKAEAQKIRIADLFHNIIGLKPALLQIFALSACLEVFAILFPIGTQIILDQVLVSTDYDLLKLVAICLSVLLVLQTTISLARSWASLIMSTRLSVQWTTALYDHLLRLPLSYFEMRHMGDVVSRFGSLGAVQQALTSDLVGVVLDGIMAIGAFAMLILYGGWLAVVVLITMAIHLLIRLVSYLPYRRANEASIVHGAKQSSHFMETIRGIASVKSLEIHERRRGTWLNLLIDSVNANLHIQKLDFLFGTSSTVLSGIDGIIMLVLGAEAVMRGDMTIGMLMAFLAYKDQFIGRVGALIDTGIRFRMLNLHSERIGDIALTEPEEDLPQLSHPPVLSRDASLKLQNITFSYGEGLPDVLRSVSFEVGEGESVAIVGPSGSGKTTLLKVMSGLIQPREGTVIFGDIEIRRLGYGNYRSLTGTVLQEDRLFAGSIAENIAAFDPAGEISWIRECARLAAISDEIEAMPMAYESMVGDMGSALSSGQVQRLFLARALYKRPRMLFLDEATSDLDESNEAKINAAVSALKITRVMVAHRPSTIAMAERLIEIASFKTP